MLLSRGFVFGVSMMMGYFIAYRWQANGTFDEMLKEAI